MPSGGFPLVNRVPSLVRRVAAIALTLGLLIAFAPPASADGRCFSDPADDVASPLDIVEACHGNSGSRITYVVRMKQGFGADVEGLVEIAMNLRGDTGGYEAFVEVGIRNGAAAAAVISQLAGAGLDGANTSSTQTAPRSEPAQSQPHDGSPEAAGGPSSGTHTGRTAAEVAAPAVVEPAVVDPATGAAPAQPSPDAKTLHMTPPRLGPTGLVPGRLTPQQLQLIQDGLAYHGVVDGTSPQAQQTGAPVVPPQPNSGPGELSAPITPPGTAAVGPNPVPDPEPVTEDAATSTAASHPQPQPAPASSGGEQQAAPASGDQAEPRAAPAQPVPQGQALPVVPGTDATASLDLATGTIEVSFDSAPLKVYGLGNTYGYQVRANDSQVQDNAPDQGTVPHDLTSSAAVPGAGQAEAPPANSPSDNITETGSTGGRNDTGGAAAEGTAGADEIPRGGASIELLFRLGLLFVFAGGGLVAYETVTRVRWQAAGPTFELSVDGGGFAPTPLTAPVRQALERAAETAEALWTRLASEESAAFVLDRAQASTVAGHLDEPLVISWTLEMGSPTTWTWSLRHGETQTVAARPLATSSAPRRVEIILASPTRAPPGRDSVAGKHPATCDGSAPTREHRAEPEPSDRAGFRPPTSTPDVRAPSPPRDVPLPRAVARPGLR